MRTTFDWAERLFQKDASDEWIALLRIGLGLQVVGYGLSLRRDWQFLLASAESGGMEMRALSEAMLSIDSPWVPRLGWLIDFGQYFGCSESSVLWFAWLLLLVAGIFLSVGLGSREAAIVAWFLHLGAAKSGQLLAYGVDQFMTIGLFYLMISPLPDAFSLDWRWRNLRPRWPELRGFMLKVLQLHLCVIYSFSGLLKCLGAGWWDGSNLWRALTRPTLGAVSPEILAYGRTFLPVVGITICLIELGYPFFIWRRLTGRVWLGLTCLMHLFIGLMMGMRLFALVMIVLNLAAFGPRHLGTLVRRRDDAATSS